MIRVPASSASQRHPVHSLRLEGPHALAFLRYNGELCAPALSRSLCSKRTTRCIKQEALHIKCKVYACQQHAHNNDPTIPYRSVHIIVFELLCCFTINTMQKIWYFIFHYRCYSIHRRLRRLPRHTRCRQPVRRRVRERPLNKQGALKRNAAVQKVHG